MCQKQKMLTFVQSEPKAETEKKNETERKVSKEIGSKIF